MEWENNGYIAISICRIDPGIIDVSPLFHSLSIALRGYLKRYTQILVSLSRGVQKKGLSQRTEGLVTL